MTYSTLITKLKGGSGSGNHGHSGIPGQVGGSAPGSVSGLEDFATTPILKKLLNGADVGTRDSQQLLTKVLDELNYTAKPKIVSGLKAAIADGDTALFRGVYGNSIGQINRHVSDFKQGKMFISAAGAYGNGVYTATNYAAVKRYTANEHGDAGVIRMALAKNAKVITSQELSDKLTSLSAHRGNELYEAMSADPSIMAVALGYDAIHVAEKGYVVLLNRGKVKVEL